MAYPALDFFAGSGLATEGLKPHFTAVWANDICEKKAAVYRENHPGDAFKLASIEDIDADEIPEAMLSWGSFPCQDLSLAGNLKGINSERSGLVWTWLTLMDEMSQSPPIIVAENVVGLLSAAEGEYYRTLHRSLTEHGYRVGAVVLDALHWVPQSRPRVFVIAIRADINTHDFEGGSGWCQPRAIQRAASDLEDWVWWNLPEPDDREADFCDLVDFSAACDKPEQSEYNLSLIPERHRKMVDLALNQGTRAFPGYKRTRNQRQVLELRFDGVAGCLRTPQGGSSRQFVIIQKNGRLETRLLTIGEAAQLMGIDESFNLPGSYNDAYRALGDAVAVPPVRFLAEHLLSPLAERISQAH